MSKEPSAAHKPVIGLAGGIGSGKSAVAEILRTLGAAVIDSDALAHAELNEPEVQRTLAEWWGDSVISAEGGIDRARLGARVFSDPASRARLEALIHPRIARRREALIEGFRGDGAIRAIVLDSPLLYEKGLDRACDVVLFVEADPAVRAARVQRSRGWSADEWRRRENLQEALDRKRQRADDVVVNNSDEGQLRQQVVRFFDSLLENPSSIKQSR